MDCSACELIAWLAEDISLTNNLAAYEGVQGMLENTYMNVKNRSSGLALAWPAIPSRHPRSCRAVRRTFDQCPRKVQRYALALKSCTGASLPIERERFPPGQECPPPNTMPVAAS